MDSERWQQIDELFGQALELGPEERSRLLDEASAGDPELRREVEALLAADRQAEDLLESPAEIRVEPGDELPGGPEADPAGKAIGPYRLERELGRGGMGTVYLASRADDAFERRVALKVLNPGMMSAAAEQRFLSERQILASLEHPLIARLYEGGTTAGGRPYLVMEYIDGTPIDRYCDRRQLDVRERLELFRQVCAAVHHAHQHLVVHRDIKPSNILVTDDGEVRLLDFGIAKLLEPEQFPMTVEATATGLRPMTLRYASPEQVRGAAITTASDVYSLGVLLYELLTGRTPHRIEGLSPAQVERVLTDEEPQKPSVAVTGAEAPPAEEPANEARPASLPTASRPQLRRQLAGDLDNIVLQALRKESERRYGSVQQLSEDLRRHLEGLPVLARQDSVVYQVGKFLRRNKLAVAAAGLFLALILAFAGAMAFQATQVARQRDRAEEERQRAEIERQRAEQVSEFLVDLFEEADPWRKGGETVTARQLMDRGAERIDRELGDQPEVRASLLAAIANVYRKLGLYPQAETQIETALEIRRDRLGPEHPDTVDTLRQRAVLYIEQGNYAAAEPLLLQVLEILEQEAEPGAGTPDRGTPDRGTPDRGTPDRELAEVLRSLATLYREVGRYAEAEEIALRALSIGRQALGPEDPWIGYALRTLAGVYRPQGRHRESEELHRQALAINTAAHGEQHPTTAGDLYHLGVERALLGDNAAAAAHLERALGIYESVFEPDHPQVADALVSLGAVYKNLGRYDEAEEHLRRVLEIYRRALGEDHPRVSYAHLNLGRVWKALGRYGEAEEDLRRAVAIAEKTFGATHVWTANCSYELGDALRRLGRLAAAEPWLERALAAREEILDDGHAVVGESLRGLAELRADQGDAAEAEALYRRALAIWESQPGTAGTEDIPASFAAFLRATGRVAEAAELEARALNLTSPRPGP